MYLAVGRRATPEGRSIPLEAKNQVRTRVRLPSRRETGK